MSIIFLKRFVVQQSFREKVNRYKIFSHSDILQNTCQSYSSKGLLYNNHFETNNKGFLSLAGEAAMVQGYSTEHMAIIVLRIFNTTHSFYYNQFQTYSTQFISSCNHIYYTQQIYILFLTLFKTVGCCTKIIHTLTILSRVREDIVHNRCQI